MMDTTTGMPSPPLRMMAPSGAPMKKKMMHASERVNFLFISTQWRRMMLLPSFIVSDLMERSLSVISTLRLASV